MPLSTACKIGKKATFIFKQGKREKQLVITVSDNGLVSARSISRDRKNLESPEMSGEHLGLRNTKGILKRIWGDEADLSIRSIENVGRKSP